MRQFILLLFLLFGTFDMACCAQRIVSFAESFSINPQTVGRIECLLPESLPGRQTVMQISYSRPPDDTIRKHGGLCAVWKVSRSLEAQQIVILSTLKLYENSLRKAMTIEREQEPADLSPYLIPEDLIQSEDKVIAAAAADLKGNNDLETVRNVFDFTTDRLEYYQFYNQRQGAKRALRKGRGDCTEYAELMVALLRNLGIPARKALGHTIHYSQQNRVGYHSWVEVYLDELGWVTFDPTWADGEQSFTTFERMENAYVLLGYGHSAERHRYKVSGSGFQVEYKSDWEDPTIRISGRAYVALHNDSIRLAHKSIDTLLSWLPEESRFIGLRAEALMREGDFESALPLIQLSFVKAGHSFERNNSKLNMAAYLANTGEEMEALKLLIALEKKHEFSAVTVTYSQLYSPLSDMEEFQQLKARGKALSQKMQKEHEAREAAAGGNN